MDEGAKEKHIGVGTAISMVVVAALIDGAQAILTLLIIGILINPAIDVFAVFLFGIWLSMHGLNMLSPKRALRFGGTFVAEFIPVASAAPLWTVCIAFTVFESRIKEISARLAARLNPFVKKQARALAPRRMSPARPVEVDEVAEPGNA